MPSGSCCCRQLVGVILSSGWPKPTCPQTQLLWSFMVNSEAPAVMHVRLSCVQYDSSCSVLQQGPCAAGSAVPGACARPTAVTRTMIRCAMQYSRGGALNRVAKGTVKYMKKARGPPCPLQCCLKQTRHASQRCVVGHPP